MLPRKLEDIKLLEILANNFERITKWTCYQCSTANLYKMSLGRRATCAAHPSHSSRVVTYKVTIDRGTEFRHIY